LRQELGRLVIDPESDPARGLLNRSESFAHFELVRLAVAPDLESHVEHFWLILWDLTGSEPYRQENLPHPTQHVVIDPAGRTGIFGLQRAKFTYTLAGRGSVLGTKFRPGMFRGFFGKNVDAITDRVLPISEVFDARDADLDEKLKATNDAAGMADDVEALLRTRLPAPDARAVEAKALVAEVEASPDLFTVAALARRAGVTARTLQRLFEAYIGIGPKWVIDRYRMIEAVEALNRDEERNLTTLAHALGYFDQAHFSKTFTALTGKPPSFYRKAG
jgi:AraC-like DNA-binding protein